MMNLTFRAPRLMIGVIFLVVPDDPPVSRLNRRFMEAISVLVDQAWQGTFAGLVKLGGLHPRDSGSGVGAQRCCL